MYFQFHREPPYLVSLVWLILPFLLYSRFLTATWAAILVCLEHSFWIAQQGFNPSDAFTKAWKFYLKTQHALVNQELDDYLRLKGINDWFTIQHHPSDEEYAECRKIVLNNLLRKSSPCLFCLAIAYMFSARPKTSTWSTLWSVGMYDVKYIINFRCYMMMCLIIFNPLLQLFFFN